MKKIMCQIMGDLPKDRVLSSRPFLKTGIDFAGPIITKPNLKRTRVTTKSYIALFISFTTKAVHLEVVSELSTDSFLACLRRFISRRGKPSDIYTDNGSNFKGARNYLYSQMEILKSASVQDFASELFINWHFIPPSAPHFGGIWESNIKSMKQHLFKVCKSAVLNYEELSTLIIQIEACMNSRPVTPLSSDPNDLDPLTPGHFLIGAPLLAMPESYQAENSLSYTSRFKLIQALREGFWRRWSAEYLTQLQQRSKWKSSNPNIKTGQLVLLKEDLKHPMKWSLGRVMETFPGDDGAVRVVQVKTTSGTFKRPITKIAPLPT
ncbi:uncharacterized protein LOC129225009 [Uloborus diversus]|uniref:uncharacterized protein LOC129225009 n=1 Tax=Uloborus diversus TaxID=327109 RepID=UPI00240A2834|nr:uncharacterized protein LOC129225009 [Uloborus diversus]